MTVSMDLSFDNTETAFAYKSDKELKSGRWLLKTMHYPWFVAVGSRLRHAGVAGKENSGGRVLEHFALLARRE